MRKILFFLFLLLLIVAGGSFFYIKKIYTEPGPLMQETSVLVPHGSHERLIHTLQNTGVIKTGSVYTYLTSLFIFLTHKEGQLHAAELSFPAHASLKNVLSVLRHGHPVLHKITIPEGLSAYQIQALINNSSFLTNISALPEEGSVMPQTYLYLRNTSRNELLKRTQEAMTNNLQQVWANRESDDKIPDIKALVILASLIERETAIPDERPLVARVFLNRLHKNMKLQTDPSVIYAITDGKTSLDHPLNHSDLQFDSPYNTYLYQGLPPGPICSPSLASLNAAAHPAQSNDLFFVANGQGGHNFSDTLKEHNKNVRTYYKNK